MAVAVSALGMGWKSTPRGPGPGTDRKSAPNVRGELSGSCWMPEFKLESCSGAGFGVIPGTDWTSGPNGRGKLSASGGCWMGGVATALPVLKLKSCGGDCGVESCSGFRLVPGTDWTSGPSGCWMGGIATALPEFKLESCSGAGFRLVLGTDWTSTPNGRGKLAGGCWLGGSACDSETMAGSGTMACQQ
jgi:hypothetical protein